MSRLAHLGPWRNAQRLMLLAATLTALGLPMSIAAQTPIDDPIVTITVQRPATNLDAPLTIGDPIIVTLTITHDARASVALPTTPQPLGDLEPAIAQLISRTEDGGTRHLALRLPHAIVLHRRPARRSTHPSSSSSTTSPAPSHHPRPESPSAPSSPPPTSRRGHSNHPSPSMARASPPSSS